MGGGKKKILVVGSGLAGLAAAALLARQGYAVTVIDKNPSPGGVARQEKKQKYTFDLGPSWYLMPQVYDIYFSHFNKKPADFYELVDLNPSYRIFFENQGRADISRDLAKNQSLFASFEKHGGKKLKKFLTNSKMKYEIAVNEFLYKDYNSILDLIDPRLMVKGLQLNILSKLDNFVSRYFKDHRCKKIVEFNTVFLGSSPFKTPALYSLMAHADLTQGVFYPLGGIVKLVQALYSLAREEGVEFVFNTQVTKIEVKDKKAVGVQAGNTYIAADIVLSALDYHHAETCLLDKAYRNYSIKYWQRKTLAPGMFLVYLGINKKLKSLKHHNFYFAKDWQTHFKSIFDNPAWPHNPCYYIGCSSKTDTTLCPQNSECVFLLVPVSPYLEDTDDTREVFANKIIEHLESLIAQEFKKNIQVKHIFSQRDFKEQHHYFQGTALGLAHTLWQTAFFRPSHINKKVKNLYYTGHYTQPGIGMPMAIISAELILDRISREHPL